MVYRSRKQSTVQQTPEDVKIGKVRVTLLLRRFREITVAVEKQ